MYNIILSILIFIKLQHREGSRKSFHLNLLCLAEA